MTGGRFIFFDLGGTILDLSCAYLSIAATWEELAIEASATPVDLARHWTEVGEKLRGSRIIGGPHGVLKVSTEAMAIAMKDLGVPGGYEIALKLTSAAALAVRQKAGPFPDARPALFQKLRGEGFGLGIITDADRDVLEDVLPRVPCRELFNPVVSSWEVGVTKPNPKIFQKALKFAGSSPRQSVFVGDSPTDVLGARSVGIRAIIVDRFNTYPKEPKPEAIIPCLDALLEALARLEMG